MTLLRKPSGLAGSLAESMSKAVQKRACGIAGKVIAGKVSELLYELKKEKRSSESLNSTFLPPEKVSR